MRFRAGGVRPNAKPLDCQLATAGGNPLTVAVSATPAATRPDLRVVVVHDVTARKQDEEQLRYLASYDVLTGLPNRRLFLGFLDNALARLPWNKQHVGLLFCDLDRFKFVNDSLGHGVGDVLLQRVSERIRAALRPGDVVGRWAGDEFVILLDELAQPEDASTVAKNIVRALSEPNQVGPHELFVTASIGTACAPYDGASGNDLVANADLAMYAAKAAGKNQVCAYQPEMGQHTRLRVELEHALRDALRKGESLRAHLQPQVTADHTLIGFEALVRWQHPELGLIAPARFLPAAEEASLMAELDQHMLELACGHLQRWARLGWNGLRIAVNLSDQSFRSRDLVERMRAVVAAYGISPRALEIELTEQIVMENVGTATDTMNALVALGVTLSIDDFGTGYSSLSQLKRCPIRQLKIDRSFVDDVITDASDQAITFAIIALSHRLGIEVLAEGVESEAQWDLLGQHGCDAYQGYWLSRPLPPDTVDDWIRQQLEHAKLTLPTALAA